MNSPEPDPALTDLASQSPRPVLRAAARRRSLDAALAALPAVPHKIKRRRLSPHWIGWAACWLVTGGFIWSSPPGPGRSYHSGPALPPPPQDEETAKLLATLYPAQDSRPRGYFSP